ncbi:hypothetical protein DTL42_16995 [Bremerella cremea]|uniref:Squalene cyclase C-terminal domain-containing protein n=1 Tax=Bremerella cremea TaxID=1031537 RepID=A0A368KQB2_9BACT|nr:prenyltransferase/squalene oxidase repeat-containing protein [Bremerella cremea]RCS44620.1 hypothetical protein DTL42_16995 [Bremerella cremea]
MLGADLALIADMSQVTSKIVWGILWGGLALITLSLLILMQTRWGQARPVSKCVILSIFAHLLLMTYAQVTSLFQPPIAHNSAPVNIRLSQVEFEENNQKHAPREVKPWDQLAMSPAPVEGMMKPLDRLDMPLPMLPGSALPEPELPNPAQRNWDMPQLTEPPLPTLETEPSITPTGPQPELELPPTPLEAKTIAPPAPTPQRNLVNNAPTPAAMPPLERIARDMPQITPPPLATAAQNEPSRDLHMLRGSHPQAEQADLLQGERDQLTASTNQLEAMSRGSATTSPTSAGQASGGPHMALDATLASLKGNKMQELWASRMAARNLPLPRATRTRMDAQPLPLIMQARVVEDPQDWVEMLGGSPEIEPAVNSALDWLAAQQEDDGRWNATRHGAGQENMVAGHDRQGAGNNADMGITGLALLAFLAKGHTHLEGKHRVTVQKALEYLVNHQAQDGSLSGQAGLYARMYCHAMALLAISEAYAMTKDERIRPFLDRGLAYTVTAQHPRMGGWRYHPGDRGDMSQFGWQVLALHSAALSGIEIDTTTRQLMTRFLDDSSAGGSKGLAAYRPGEKATPTMTAEALTCRFFLGIEDKPEQISEATDFLLLNQPSDGCVDLYYAYYGTLSMYQMQDEAWKKWADTLHPRLLSSQIKGGELAGSWNPDCHWGGYGGRIYSTAMATLSLEVYFRYLPIYRDVLPEEPHIAEKPVPSISIPR